MTVPTEYVMEIWEGLEAQHETGYAGEAEDMRELDRYVAAHRAYDLLSVLDREND